MPVPLNGRPETARHRKPRRKASRNLSTPKNKKKEPSRELWTTDCETDPFHACEDPACAKCAGVGRVPQPFVWGAFNGHRDEYHEFSTVHELARFFERRKATVYAHNGGKFDYHYLRDELNSDEPVMVINGRLSKFKIGECEFRDSLNIFPNTRLKDFGIKDEIDYELMEPDKRNDPNVYAQIRKYLKQDCVGLWDMVERYRKEYGTKLTQAGASMKYWEKNHFKDDAPRQTKRQHELYRPYYNGGRVQCFARGVGTRPFKVADINSAYPFAMLQEHPIECEGELRNRLPPDRLIKHCLISFVGSARGSLPWRDERDNELYFPDDDCGRRHPQKRLYHVTGWEFEAALELDAVKVHRIVSVHMFWKRIAFKDYIDHFFNLREDARIRGDVAGRIFGKYFMNSLYGKFGADPSKYSEYVIASEDSYESWKQKGYQDYKPWGSRYLMEKPIDERHQRFYNVCTAASVTGFVRAYLFRALHSSSGLVYCDTDSIAATSFGKGMDYGTRLGQWKHEGCFDRFAVAGKKLYAFHKEGAGDEYDPTADEKESNWKLAGKGINLKDVKNAPQMIEDIANGARIKVLNQSPCYTITRAAPIFIHRAVTRTYKDVSIAPESEAA